MPDDLFLVSYRVGDESRLALQDDEGTFAVDSYLVPSLHWLFRGITADEVPDRLRDSRRERLNLTDLIVQPPLDQQAIWAADNTYKRSADKPRDEISAHAYTDDRPELFFKAYSQDVIGNGHPIGIRFDSKRTMPEPELVLVLNSYLEVVGLSIGNDMTAVDIASANPLYLQQAKVYARSCAIGPRLWIQQGLTVWPDLPIRMSINRRGRMLFDGKTSTLNITRPLHELVDYLGRCQAFPNGVMLFSGCGITPPDDVVLSEEDEIRIRIDPIGELVNKAALVGTETVGSRR